MVREKRLDKRAKLPSSNRHQEIIRCALNLFAKQGYETTSMEDIAAACKMSKGNFYNYFKAKKDLVEAIINLANEEYLRNTRNETSKIKLLGAEEALKRQIKLYLRTVDNNKDVYIFLNHVVANLVKNDRQPIYQTADDIARSFEQILSAGVKNGSFRKMNTKMVSLNITVLCTGWAYYRWKYKHICTLKQYEKELISFTARGLSVT